MDENNSGQDAPEAPADPVAMCKPGCKDISVNPGAVETFEADGWQRRNGEEVTPDPAEDEGSGLSDTEKQMEIDAAGEVARKKSTKEGRTKEEIDDDVEAAKAAAAEALAD